MLISQGQVDITQHIAAGRRRHDAFALAHRRAGDRPLHDAGHPAADEAAGAAGLARSVVRRVGGQAARPRRAAQPLVGGVGGRGTGRGAGRRGPRGAGRHHLAAIGGGRRRVRPPLDRHRAVRVGAAGDDPRRLSRAAQTTSARPPTPPPTIPLWRIPTPALLEECFRYGADGAPDGQPARGCFRRWPRPSPGRRPIISGSCTSRCCCWPRRTTSCWDRPPRRPRLLDKARVAIGRRTMGAGRIGARRSFLDGTVLFQQKKVADGDAAISRGHELHAARLALAVPNPPGRQPGHQQGHATRDGDGPVPGRAPRPAARRLGLRPDGIAGRAGHAAPAALRALVQGGPGAQGPRGGHRDRRPHAAAPLLHLAALRRAAGIAALGPGSPRRHRSTRRASSIARTS